MHDDVYVKCPEFCQQFPAILRALSKIAKSGTNRKLQFWQKFKIWPTLHSPPELPKALYIGRMIVLRSLKCLDDEKLDLYAQI